jgi:choline dehydrogenase-like flavoprotein
MFIDARGVPGDGLVESDVCIVGGGVAGITLALRLAERGMRVCLLEGGGFSRQEDEQALYRGENVGLPYELLDEARSRFLGGSSNCWGGWCRPLDPLDFEPRDWVPNSGWPIGAGDVAPYYAQAHKILALGPFDYDPASWQRWIPRPGLRFLPLDPGRIASMIVQFSPPLRFGRTYRDALDSASKLGVYLHANACELTTGGDGRRVDRLRVRTLGGREFAVTARLFVLAAGGIENARLLLLSNRSCGAGLGNGYDQVGRYFMDHPRLRLGEARFAQHWRCNPLYDVKYNYHNPALSAGNVAVAAHLAPTPALQQTEGLLNARVYFASIFAGEALLHLPSLLELRRRLRERPPTPVTRPLVRGLGLGHKLAYHLYGHLRLPQAFVRRQMIETVVEPVPDPESRVMLSSERDALGLNRVRLRWRVGELERRTMRRLHMVLDQEMRRSGIGELRAGFGDDSPVQPKLGWCWHHMGTTRMAANPRHGVVDRNCLVHGAANLYVAGSSVFPTCGSDTPTITIVALTLRLADHIVASLATMA